MLKTKEMRSIIRVYFEFFFRFLKANVSNNTYGSTIGFELILESLFSTNIIFYTIQKNPLLEQNRKTTIAVIEHNYIRIFITTTQIWVLSPVNFNEKTI